MWTRLSKRHLISIAVIAIAFLWLRAGTTLADGNNATASEQVATRLSGATWFRCFIRVPAALAVPATPDLQRDSITLNVTAIHAPFEIDINGEKIAEGGPSIEGPRRFKVPKGILQNDVFNTLAIRLDGNVDAAALGESPTLADYHDELRLDKPWEISHGKIDPAALKPLTAQPVSAFYTESGFKPASSPLERNAVFMPGVRIPPNESLAKMKTADDLTVDLIASEPLVAQPTHISFDEHGRMWVAQYRQYPYPAGLHMISRDTWYRARFDKVPPAPPYQDKGADIITVHWQSHADGVFDQSKVVLRDLNMANAALRGHGGIWVMNTPYLMFYADANGDDVPDRDPEVRLAGFGLEDAHAVSNGLIWGPDGWIYGCEGSTVTSRIRRPGIDPLGAGVYSEGCIVWRYQPEKKIYEVFSEGGGNNFGLNFDAEGRLFSGHNGGVTHGWYFIQSGLYLKQGFDSGKYGPPANPYAFGSLPQIQNAKPIPRFTHDILMFDGTALPEHYVGKMFGADPLHRLLTLSERTPVGSTFQTTDIGTPLTSSDITFRPVYMANGPDGALYIADFCEEFIAHGQHYQGQIDPTSGRIWRLRGKGMPLEKDTDLAAKSTAQLVALLNHPNLWHRQTAVRLLGERKDSSALEPLRQLLKDSATHPALEALWALYQMDALGQPTAIELLNHPSGPVRAWTVRLMGDAKALSVDFYAALLKRIAIENDAEVRAQIAATSRRLPVDQALGIISTMMHRNADAGDPFIPMLCWWTIEAHCDTDRDAVLGLLKNPDDWHTAVIQQFILSRLMRRLAMPATHNGFLACAALLDIAPTAADRKILIDGFEDAFKGRALPPIPQELAEVLAKSGQASPLLRVRLGDAAAIDATLKLAANPASRYEDRLPAVQIFGEVKTPSAVPILLTIVSENATSELRKAALNSLQLYEDNEIGATIAQDYADLPREVQSAALNLLASRPAWSLELLKRIDKGQLKFTAMPADVLSRLRTQQNPQVAALVGKLFPPTRPPAKTARSAEIARVRSIIEHGSGDPYKGEATFMQRCAVCHTLFFKGGNIGPNLTNYQRDDLGTMLISVIDPSAEIREGYQNFILKTKDGRTLSGFLADHDADGVSIRGLDGQDTRISRANVAELKAMPTSIMPEGLLAGLNDQQLRDFFAYLRISQPISK